MSPLLELAPSEIMVKRHDIQDGEEYMDTQAIISRAYLFAGVGLGFAIGALSMVLEISVYGLALCALGYLGIGAYYDRVFYRRVQP